MWFATPPLNNIHGPMEIVSPKDGKPLGHTPEYLAAKEKRRKLIAERKRQVQERIAAEQGAEVEKADVDDRPSPKRKKITDAQVDALLLQTLTDRILNANEEWYQYQYGDRAAEVAKFDTLRAAERQKEVEAKKAHFLERRRLEEARREKEKAMEGRVFRDDWDERH